MQFPIHVCQKVENPFVKRIYLHVKTVGYDGQDGYSVNEDNPGNRCSGVGLHVDGRGAGDGLQPVHRNPGQAQG